MLLPGSFLLSLSLDFLNFPRLLLGVGVFCCCIIITVSSRSNRSISRAANSCSRCLRISSFCLCCTCAFVNSSSRQRNSCGNDPNPVLESRRKFSLIRHSHGSSKLAPSFIQLKVYGRTIVDSYLFERTACLCKAF